MQNMLFGHTVPKSRKTILATLLTGLLVPVALVSCGGGGGGGSGAGTASLNFNVAALGTQNLSAAEVSEIVSRAVQASIDRGQVSTIAIVDRVGNVLGVYQMTNAATNTTITSGISGANGNGLDGQVVPSTLAAISKAITGAYLSSTGNAFSTRTASQIVQEFFQPGERGQPSGPLYGVQFSQLPCSDLNVWLSQSASIGPKRSPLGLSADPGGFPIYQEGRVIGGIGVISSPNAGTNGVYSLDRDLTTVETDLDEEIAFAALSDSFRAPDQIRANRITAGGQTFQFSNTTPAVATTGNLAASGAFVTVGGFTTSNVPTDGTAYGSAPSGYVATSNAAFNGLNAFNLTTNPADSTSVRYPPIAGTNAGTALTQAEVQTTLTEALKVANRARAQIRQPLGTYAQVTISMVDTTGRVIGQIRSDDAPIFGTDVSLQKARSALAFSATTAKTDFQNAGVGSFTNAMDAFFQQQASVLDGTVGFSARAIGTVHRPYFPDGQEGTPNGPLSSPLSSWSPFNIGFQLNLSAGKVFQALGLSAPALTRDGTFFATPNAANSCTPTNLQAGTNAFSYANGMQIFPGGFPIFKGDTIVGAIGVSGDGVDQDDMIGYLGVINGASATSSNIRPFPSSLRRADALSNGGQFLRYVQCPQSPFIDNPAQQNVCP